jgi:hypothetical protein
MPPQSITCKRVGGSRLSGHYALRVSIRPEVVQHSPTGFEWGYNGSGPADFALNVLHQFLPPGCDGLEPVPLWKGECSASAWVLHQGFKREVIAQLPEEGGTITREEIERWLDAHGCPHYRSPAPPPE